MQTLMDNQVKNDRFLQNKIRNLDTSHVMGMQQALYTRWRVLTKQTNQDEIDAQHVQNRNQFVNKLVRYSMQSLMLAIAAMLTVQGKISVGSMIASNVLIGRALQPFDVIVSTWRQFILAKSAATALGELLLTPTEPSSYSPIEQIAGNISLKNVGVALGDVALDKSSMPILQNINLEITPGRILNIMGASGSGKTTMARVLVGLIVPHAGKLCVDGTLIQNINPALLAASVGYLPQRVALIEGTIAENVARFGALDTAQIIAACQAVGMHEAILRMPFGYDLSLIHI